MKIFGFIALSFAAALAAPAVSANEGTAVTTIIVDNRANTCNVDSRIAEGNRIRARVTVNKVVRNLKAQGKAYKIVRLESGGDRGFSIPTVDGAVLVKVC